MPPGIFLLVLSFHLVFNQTLDALPSHILMPFNGPVPIYWTRLRVESRRPKVPRIDLIRNVQLAPKLLSLLTVEPGTALPLLELPRNHVKRRNRMRFSGRRATPTEEGPCIASPACISSSTLSSARRTVSKTTKVSIVQWDSGHFPPYSSSTN